VSSSPASGPVRRAPGTASFRAADRLHVGRCRERAGCVAEAMQCYREAVAAAESSGEWAAESEALRRVAVLHHHRGEHAEAIQACDRSHALALENADSVLAAEALNVSALFALERGDLEAAGRLFRAALEMGGASSELVARVEQNLGVIATVRGRTGEALEHYTASLESHRRAGNEHGCALAYHNLGMISADRELWAEADDYFERSRTIAERLGDLHLQGLCLLNHAEVHSALQRFEDARRGAESALAIFDQLGSLLDKTDAYRVIGTIYRETGRTALAESRLTAAMELAARTGALLSEAEAGRELAFLYQAMGRNQDALSLLNRSHGLFHRLDARADAVDISRKVAQLEEAFFQVVREWGQSIESSDSYTFGHCERVAGYAVAVGRALGMEAGEITAVRLGAYLHDVGKIRVPHEILNKPGRLSSDEFDVIRMHPIWGVELLEEVDFPWDIKPVIRWHHERMDGTGYPDRLRGDEIPLAAQVIGIVDVFDALTTTRSYRPAMTRLAALAELQSCRGWWRDDVYEAFMRAVGTEASLSTASPRAA
jgi:putative nucleotidyltransferase with HDIG domain